VTGNLAAFADAGILLDFDKRADLCFVPDLTPVEIYEFRQPDILPKLHVVRDAVKVVHR
jgi:hypothetical protein